MINKRIISFSLMLVLVFLIIGLNAVSAEDNSDVLASNNLDLLNSSSVSILNSNWGSDSSSASVSNNNLDNSNLDSNSNNLDNSNLNSDNNLNNNLKEGLDESLNNNLEDALGDINHDANSKIKSDNSKKVHTITESNYSVYFDSNGYLNNSLVSANDTINLSGNFSSKYFRFSIPLTITSLNGDAYLRNSPIIFTGVSNENYKYDAIVSNLRIESDLANISAVWVIGSSNIKVLDNNIFTTGHNGYPIALDSFVYNCIIANNTIKTIVPIAEAQSSLHVFEDGNEENKSDNSSWQHSGISLRDAHYNTVVDNDITVENSYGVYLCYGASISNNNVIANNTIRSTSETPSFWCYGVYITGNHNLIYGNDFFNLYQGIHSSYPYNEIISNSIYDIAGLDDNYGVGGDFAIYGGNNTLIANNSIYNADLYNAGILVGTNSEVYGNYIQINSSGEGIRIGDKEGGSYSKVYNNTVDFLDGKGICLYGEPNSTVVYDNIINSLECIGASQGSGSGIGIYSVYQSRAKRPYNMTTCNNTIYTSNDIAINIAQSSTESYSCSGNLIFGKGIVYPMAVVYIPEYGEGNVYELTDENFQDYFDSNNELKDNVKDGDSLIFVGEFSPKGKINLKKSVNLFGYDALLKNTTINVFAPNCRVHNFTIINNGLDNGDLNLWGVYVFEADNASIVGNNITIKDKNTSYGIYLCDSIDNNVSDNIISCQGDNLVFSLLTYETYNTLFENNSILAIGTDELYPYYETICIDGVRSISELSKTYGVILDFSSDNQFIHNNIEVTSTLEGFHVPYNPSVNILIGLYIYYASNRNNISENNVYVHGHDPFLYGVGSSGDDTSKSVTYACENIFSRNNITLEGDYFVMGMILRHNSKDTIVDSNYFRLDSNNYTYGITLEISEGAKVRNNVLNSTGNAGIYAMELYASNSNDISYNEIYASASYSSVALYASSNNNVTHNVIRTYGNKVQEPAQGTEHPDSVELFNTGISFQKYSSNNRVEFNDIQTDGDAAIDFDPTSAGNTIGNNKLSSTKGGGNAAVNDRSGQNTVFGNTGSRYVPNSENSTENNNNNQNSNSNKHNSVPYNGSSSRSSDESSGSSAFGQVDLGLLANALSSIGEGTGDVGESDGDLIASELEEVASKSLSGGLSVPIAALLLVLMFCFSFLNAKDEDDDE